MKKIFLSIIAVSALFFTSCSSDNDGPIDVKSTIIEEIIGAIKFVKDADIKSEVNKNAKKDLTDWAIEFEELKKLTDKAKKGKEGFLPDGEKKRFLNAKGIEVEQLIKKGLIGAFQLNGFNNALMLGVQVKEAKERKEALDKAVSYILGDYKGEPKSKDQFKAEGNSFGKYMVSVSKSTKYKDIDSKIYETIKVASKNTNEAKVYNAALLELNDYVTKVVAFRGVHYLAKYGEKIKEKNGFTGHNVHELSEGLGFAYSLQFAYNGKTHGYYLTSEEAKEFSTVNLWDEAEGKTSVLAKGSEKIAKLFGFTVEEAKE
ncbi:MAG: DUF4856 domain-containing protein [Tenacibaculum sp.]|nr:DUF4856 domain-containing protein [Tenacibaculum sp.]